MRIAVDVVGRKSHFNQKFFDHFVPGFGAVYFFMIEQRFSYEPLLGSPARELVGYLAEEYFFIQLYRALLESHSSENGARLLAMTAASGNIDDRFDEVTREFRSVRQDAITSELLDVVAGAEALTA